MHRREDLNCMIVDDEPLAVDVLEEHIEKYPGLTLQKKSRNATEAISYLRNNTNIDVIFLDIMMPRITGIQLLNSIQHPPIIVFTTAHRKYAFNGYDFDIIDFLLKPISYDRFAKAARKIFSYKKLSEQFDNKNIEDEDRKMFIRSGTKMVRLYMNDIVYIEGMKDYMKLHMKAGNIVVVKKTMKSFEEQLKGYSFLRVHKSFIVCTSYIQVVLQDKIKIENGYIPIGRNYRQYVKKFVDDNRIEI